MKPKQIAIIGAGHSGLCMGIRLKLAGIDSFIIYEKAASLGGTWRDNTYPGAACDSPAMVYCYSFEQKTDWTQKWCPQAEIFAYQQHCAERYQLHSHFRFNTEIASAVFDAAQSCWLLRTISGEEIVADIVICASGQLSTPALPEIPGLADFEGHSWHSARWNHSVDLSDKRVTLIGSAATAVQLTPELATQAKALTIFQRSANWVVDRGNRRFKPWETWAFTHIPLAARLYRYYLMLDSEFFIRGIIRQVRWLAAIGKQRVLHTIRTEVNDPTRQQALQPDYTIGAKRILIFDDYYSCFNRDNVSLVTDPIARIEAHGVQTQSGQNIPADVIIFATGFQTNKFLTPMKFTGLNGLELNQEWRQGAHAYKGITVADFPNFFMLYGPNTNLGHLSIIFMIECQANYILDAVRQLQQKNLKCVNLKREIMDAHNHRLQQQLATTAWATVEHSWYMTKERKITNNYPGSSPAYWWATRKFDLENYQAE